MLWMGNMLDKRPFLSKICFLEVIISWYLSDLFQSYTVIIQHAGSCWSSILLCENFFSFLPQVIWRISPGRGQSRGSWEAHREILAKHWGHWAEPQFKCQSLFLPLHWKGGIPETNYWSMRKWFTVSKNYELYDLNSYMKLLCGPETDLAEISSWMLGIVWLHCGSCPLQWASSWRLVPCIKESFLLVSIVFIRL